MNWSCSWCTVAHTYTDRTDHRLPITALRGFTFFPFSRGPIRRLGHWSRTKPLLKVTQKALKNSKVIQRPAEELFLVSKTRGRPTTQNMQGRFLALCSIAFIANVTEGTWTASSCGKYVSRVEDAHHHIGYPCGGGDRGGVSIFLFCHTTVTYHARLTTKKGRSKDWKKNQIARIGSYACIK